MSTLDDIRQTFFQECEELLEALDDGLGALPTADDGGETVNAVFRAVHSIKGGAAAFGLDALVRFAHRFETTLDDVRAGRLAIDEGLLQVCMRAADQLAEIVVASRDGTPIAPDTGAAVIARLEALSFGGGAPSSAPAPLAVIPITLDAQDAEFTFEPLPLGFLLPPDDYAGGADLPQGRGFTLRFAAQAALFDTGHDPVHIFRELADLGELTVAVDTADLPALADITPHDCALVWTLTLLTDAPVATVQDVFEFVTGLCQLDIAPLASPDVAPATTTPAPAAPPTARPKEPERTPAPAGAAAPAPAAATQGQTVRVDLDDVDRLINTVGELVINQAVLTQAIADAKVPTTTAMLAALDEFMMLAREIQDGVMAIRAQSVKPLFQRMARIAREASDLAGKTVRFVTEGEATEVDKTVIERLVDPLTHIIRNAVDHGLESEQDRLAAGKPATGTVTLHAAHRSGRVLIDVSDDGAGINRKKVFEIAARKGLVPADAVMSDAEIDKLLFLPGFSTATTVTNLSGRGVGMDVVRAAIQKLGGRIGISSTPGKGTTMSISLPLTLAVLDGMIVDVAGHTMVVPITTIVETVRPNASDIHDLTGGSRVIAVRDHFFPVVDLAVVFGYRAARADLSDLVYLLVETDTAQRWALAVDSILDQRQVVIKGLERNYRHISGIAAATILGDGKVALIIDPEQVVLFDAASTPAPQEVWT